MSKEQRIELVFIILIWCFATAMVTLAYVRNTYVSKQDLIDTGLFMLDSKTDKLIVTPKEAVKP